MIFSIGIIIACFLLLLLILKKGKTFSDFILTGWLCVMTVHLFLHYLHYTQLDYQYPWVLGFILPLPVLHGVLLYFYSLALTRSKFPSAFKTALHLLPFFMLIVLAIPFYSLSGAEKKDIFLHEGKGYEWYSLIQLCLTLITGFSYSLATVLVIREYRERIQQFLSNTDKKMLRWLEYLTIGLGLIWLLVLLFDDTIIFTGVTIFILFIGLFGINQGALFSSAERNDIPNPGPDPLKTGENESTQVKYAKSRLEQEDISDIMQRLEQLMSEQKPFTDSELTLNDLSEKMNLLPNQLSQVINSASGKTFYHYVNTYRVKEFLHLSSLPENKKYTFVALAYDCGFNSKTTFNKYFKLYTGKTPSDYIQQEQEYGASV